MQQDARYRKVLESNGPQLEALSPSCSKSMDTPSPLVSAKLHHRAKGHDEQTQKHPEVSQELEEDVIHSPRHRTVQQWEHNHEHAWALAMA